jgi:hypothetical protein
MNLPALDGRPQTGCACELMLQTISKMSVMKNIGFNYWQEGNMWLGYLDEYPDYMTEGTSLDDLKEHLVDLYKDLSSGAIPCVRRHAELELA